MQRFKNYSLKNFNTFGIDAKADELIIIESYADLKSIYDEGVFKSAYMILGGGSDILFTEDYKGRIIKINLLGKDILLDEDLITLVQAYAGEDWDEFVEFCVSNNIGGTENLSLIPGSVGAAPVQNIGAYGVEAKDIIETVEYFGIEDGEFHTLNNAECEFEYRTSIFKNALKGKAIVTKVTFKFKKPHILVTNYPDVVAGIEALGITAEQLTIRQLRDMISEIRRRKLPQPDEVGNAGSFFKNPVVPKAKFEELKTQYPEIKGHETENGSIKLSAGWLIETAGWKGWTSEDGSYGVSKKHALVLVNYGNASGKQIHELALKIKSDIQEKFGIELSEEVIYV